VLQRLARLVFRIGGWLLTPIVTILAAGLGATIGAVVAPRLSATGGLVASAIGGLVGATAGLWVWTRLLRRSPELRDVLHVTPEGVPTEEAMTDVIGQDPPESRTDA
jgi:hypothetical protein